MARVDRTHAAVPALGSGSGRAAQARCMWTTIRSRTDPGGWHAEQRRSALVGLLDDPHGVRLDDLDGCHQVQVLTGRGRQDHLVAGDESVEIAKITMVADTVTGDDHIAGLTRQRGSRPMPRTVVERRQPDAFEHRPDQAELGDLDGADLDLRLDGAVLDGWRRRHGQHRQRDRDRRRGDGRRGRRSRRSRRRRRCRSGSRAATSSQPGPLRGPRRCSRPGRDVSRSSGPDVQPASNPTVATEAAILIESCRTPTGWHAATRLPRRRNLGRARLSASSTHDATRRRPARIRCGRASRLGSPGRIGAAHLRCLARSVTQHDASIAGGAVTTGVGDGRLQGCGRRRLAS